MYPEGARKGNMSQSDRARRESFASETLYSFNKIIRYHIDFLLFCSRIRGKIFYEKNKKKEVRKGERWMKYDKSVFQSLIMVTQFGIHMLVPIILCTFLGIFLDKRLGTSFLAILLFFMGAAAGFRNIFIIVKQMNDKNKEKSKR